MTLGELIETTLVKDTDVITVKTRYHGRVQRVRRGQWYQDHILDVTDKEIDSLRYLKNHKGPENFIYVEIDYDNLDMEG